MQNFQFYPKETKPTLRCARGAPWPCILSVWCSIVPNSSCAGTAAAARRARARVVPPPFELRAGGGDHYTPIYPKRGGHSEKWGGHMSKLALS